MDGMLVPPSNTWVDQGESRQIVVLTWGLPNPVQLRSAGGDATGRNSDG